MSPSGKYPEPDPIRPPWTDAKPTAFDKICAAACCMLCLLFLIPLFLGKTGQLEGDPAATADRREAAQRARDMDRADCHRIDLCKDFADARQSCATAGSYNRCMDIRLGGANFSEASFACSNNGRPLYMLSEVAPNKLTCLANLLGL